MSDILCVTINKPVSIPPENKPDPFRPGVPSILRRSHYTEPECFRCCFDRVEDAAAHKKLSEQGSKFQPEGGIIL